MPNQIITNTLRIYNQGIYLRDMFMEDIDDYINWNTNEIEWQDWDAPWEDEEVNVEELRISLLQRLNKELPEVRKRFEICTIDGQHIGWLSSYYIDEDKTKLAVGIDIPNNKFRGKKMGESAITLFISYLLKSGVVSEIYTQTWSGNLRMVRLAEKCGLYVESREINNREVRGNMYDGLTFKLNKDLFWDRFSHLK
ncbi:GNAT family N-acetyltransferase [Desnuesiella massiliensis]|uniref:GNAT family N-acetyltransferase n=1 Tax=Desnuesiella massiliensis TaxID=1650662 RepID=UPI0006E1F60C|nr:GNAT family protein [Desnuesiella massiliensis]